MLGGRGMEIDLHIFFGCFQVLKELGQQVGTCQVCTGNFF